MSSHLLNLSSITRILQCSNFHAPVIGQCTDTVHVTGAQVIFCWSRTGLMLKGQISPHLCFAHKAKGK
jgi:hypothetical protein